MWQVAGEFSAHRDSRVAGIHVKLKTPMLFRRLAISSPEGVRPMISSTSETIYTGPDEFAEHQGPLIRLAAERCSCDAWPTPENLHLRCLAQCIRMLDRSALDHRTNAKRIVSRQSHPLSLHFVITESK